MHFRRARGELVVGQRGEAMPHRPHGVAFAPGGFQIHFPAMNHVRIDGAFVGEQHEIFRARLVALGVDGGKIFGRARAGGGDDSGARLGYELLQRIESLFHFGVKRAPLFGIGRGLKRRLQRRFRCAAKHAVQRIIIRRRNGVVLVVVTARARNGQPHQPARRHVDAVIENVVDVPRKPRAEREKAEGRQRRFIFAEVELVGGELLDDELVERLVVIQRTDNVVAIRPRPRESFFLKKNIALVVRVTRDIEPMARPMLAVAGGFQQPINFGFKIFKFKFLLRRQTSKGEMSTAV